MDGISESIGMVQHAITLSVLRQSMGQSEAVIEELMGDMLEGLDVGISDTLGMNIDISG